MAVEPDKPSIVGEVQYTTQAAPQGRSLAVEAPVRTMLVVPAEEMTPSRVSAVAGRLGVSTRQIQDLVDAGRPVPVQASLRGQQVITELHDEPLDVVPAGMPGVGLPAIAVGAGMVGAGLLALGAGLALSLSLIGGLAAAGVGGMILAAAVIPLVLWGSRYAEYQRTASSWKGLRDASRAARAHALTGDARERLAAVRVHLATSDLNTIAEADIRSGLKEIEEDLDTLERSWNQLPTGSAGQDDRDRLEAQVGRVAGGLEDLRAWLTQASMDATGEAGDALQRTLQAAQLAVDGLRS